MPTAKRKGNKQPGDDSALEKATDAAVKDAADDAKTGDVITADEPGDTLHLRDVRPE